MTGKPSLAVAQIPLHAESFRDEKQLKGIQEEVTAGHGVASLSEKDTKNERIGLVTEELGSELELPGGEREQIRIWVVK